MNLNTTQYLTPLARQNNTPITGGNVLSVTDISAWKCVFVHALSNEEEQGAHNVYIDLLDPDGHRLQPTAAIAIEYGWDGMQSNEKPPFAPLEKLSPEPLANIPLYRGQRLWVGVKDAIGSDIAQNFTSDPDGHQSFYVVFQRQSKTTVPQKPNTITVSMDVILDIERRLAELTTAVHGLR